MESNAEINTVFIIFIFVIESEERRNVVKGLSRTRPFIKNIWVMNPKTFSTHFYNKDTFLLQINNCIKKECLLWKDGI